ncbi:MAG: SDR family oxidoreductase [Hyphomicrobiales bacterium]|nr:SDR family oxidoreductase [Hyphomicrobiales bacterium]MCP5370653.1 SDR family oxidoreductase [Hyphomicrobiales bacterium]
MFQDNLLAGKKVLITGGGTGLGKSIGRRYLELGAELVICGRRVEVLEATAQEFRAETGGTVTTHGCDVRDSGAVEAMFDAIWADGPLDGLVNNAAGNFIARTETLSPRAFDAVVDIVLRGAAYCILACGRRWIAAGRGGTILSVSTSGAEQGRAFTVPSAAAKAGVVAMTRSLAVEWGPKGIRLNAVAPGYFPTPGAWERLFPADAVARPQEMQVPLRRLGEHIELANLFSYLMSDGAAYVNGQFITIDGGRALQEGGGGDAVKPLFDWTEDQWAAFRDVGRAKK